MKTLFLATIASFILTTGFASATDIVANPIMEKVTTISFSVKVAANSTALDGAKVSVIQNGNVISTGLSMRGKAQVYIENDQPFTLKVEKAGHKTFTKEIATVTQGETINVTLMPMSRKEITPRK